MIVLGTGNTIANKIELLLLGRFNFNRVRQTISSVYLTQGPADTVVSLPSPGICIVSLLTHLYETDFYLFIVYNNDNLQYLHTIFFRALKIFKIHDLICSFKKP